MRWIRLDVSWDDSPWLFVLSEGSQLAWIKLLCHIKVWGTGGRCKSLSPLVASRKWGVGEESVTKMLQAAASHGALVVEDSEWFVSNWAKFQEMDSTATERKRRERAKSNGPPVTACHAVTTVTGGVTRHVTETETETETESLTNTDKLPTETGRGGVGGESRIGLDPPLRVAPEFVGSEETESSRGVNASHLGRGGRPLVPIQSFYEERGEGCDEPDADDRETLQRQLAKLKRGAV